MDRLCLIEDEPSIARLLASRLRDEGFDVEAYQTADMPLKKAREGLLWDFYLVDVMLPGMSGVDFCKDLKAVSPTVPVLMLSALSEPQNRIEGLRSGAEDYMTKPFDFEELVVRIRGMLRRRAWYRSESRVFRWGDNEVDFGGMQGRHGRRTFALGLKECMLLKLLIERRGEVVTRDEILDRIWGDQAFPTARTVDNFILRLRRYFEDAPATPRYIHSVRGMGYRFLAEP